MNGNKDDTLQGQDNKRIQCQVATNKESTAAWQDSETKYDVDLVSKPSIESVVDAKDWVDNGSRL